MKLISLTKGGFAKVDDADYEWLSQLKWTYDSDGYVIRYARSNGKRRMMWMHRLVANTPDGMQTDHKDRNKFNNQRDNLRPCTCSQNQMNADIRTDNTSGFRGVSWHKPKAKWRAQIRANGKKRQIGLFDTAEEAALAYDDAARKLHGDFVNLNFQ